MPQGAAQTGLGNRTGPGGQTLVTEQIEVSGQVGVNRGCGQSLGAQMRQQDRQGKWRFSWLQRRWLDQQDVCHEKTPGAAGKAQEQSAISSPKRARS